MIAVIGGGICGLATAWRLAEWGADVTVFERGEPAREATWAAAGYLTPTPGSDAFAALTRESTGEWPAFACRLASITGRDLDYRCAGSIDVALPEWEAGLRAELDELTAQGWPVSWLDAQALRDREPGMAPGVAGGLFNPLTHWVDPREVGTALCVALERCGTAIRRGAAVERIHVGAGGVEGLTVAGRSVEARTVVLAAGVWTSAIAGLPEGALPPLHPVKGQMVALRMRPGKPSASHVLRRPSGAIVPRSDGRLVIGTTREDGVFDKAVDRAAIDRMIADAARVLPDLAELDIVETWTGLRPYTASGWPMVGATAVPGLFAGIGLGADGIILAPAVSRHLAAAVAGDAPAPSIMAFAAPA